MKIKYTFLVIATILIVLAFQGFILKSSSENYLYPLNSLSSMASEKIHYSNRLSEEEVINSIGDTFDINLDMDEFKEEMRELKKELAELKSFKLEFDFDSEEFKEEMAQLKKELSQIDFNKIQLEFDSEKFRQNMEELKRDLKEKKLSFEIDMDKFKEEMKDLSEELKDLDFNLKDINIELNKLKGFMNNLKEELVADGLINNKEEEFDLELSSDKMVINGEALPEELFEKYKKMYEKHFGKKLQGDHNLIIR